ncbi:amino acid adenylation domain-containing protein [Nocardia transvalensis]|uniref:amino acid adenylation domain-containing protein n=1 Tax=Nocardia transvalensis TaxID=37333 RepID=UPI0018942B46|nr:non-ribosomal peptide synthetase [Nocardia transvalensis]MBF6331099.1 amino acid adenylation domain-containing protein [Nocardia transvalensis]
MSENRFPLTEYQRDIWTQAVLFPGRAAYNSVSSVRMLGTPDMRTLNECVRDLHARHDALRLRFGSENGIPFQWVSDEIPPDIEYVDLSGEPDPRNACTAWMEHTAGQPFEFTDGGPMARVFLLRESDEVHYLFLSSHHLVADGMSLGIFMPELLRSYTARIMTGQPLDVAGSSYREFADSVADYTGSEAWSDDLRFFRTRLDGYRPALFDRAARVADEFRPEHRSFVLEPDLVKCIRTRSTSLYSHFLASLAIYLGRMHRTDDVVIGVPFGNRRSESERSTLGTFANMLPLRIRLVEDSPLGEMTRRIQDEIDATKPHERISFGSLLNNLPESAPPGRQLFDVAVSKVRLPMLGAFSDKLEDFRIYPAGHSPIALQMYLREYSQDEVTLEIDYYPDVFDADHPIEMVGRRLLHLMTMIAEHPEFELRQANPMLPEEKAAIARWNSNAYPYDRTLTLDRAFTQQVRRTPDAVAVRGTGTLTYAELDAKSDALATVLRRRGIRRGDRVAVVMERRPELLVAILATLKCGAAYVPIDPNYPRRRVEYLLSDSAAPAVLACRDLALIAEHPELPFVLVDDPLPDPVPAEPVATGRDLAYVIYTSGSTGRPKGVMIEHHSVINRLGWMQRTYQLDADDVVLQKTPISFDVSVWELFWWTLSGAKLALLPPGAEKDPAELLDAIAAQGVTVMHFVPSMLDPFLDLLEREPDRLAQTATLRLVFSSGEALRRGLVDRFNRVFARDGQRSVRLVNLYGPTEATVDVTYHETHADPNVGAARVPIGHPIDNIELHVLGPNDIEQPIGMPGELVIGGAGVARGYLNRPALTAEKFHANPFGADGRIYRTGDLVRRLADGSLEYLGRIDSQVKIRGNRVELGEVEDALMSAEAVRAAAATVLDDPIRGTVLVGYYVADHQLDPRRLRAHLVTVLPQFMVPAQFQRLDRIPLGPSGKVDRKALPAFAGRTAPSHIRDGVAVGVERVIADVFAQVLGVDSVGPDDDFYALGGDSLLVLQVCAIAGQRGVQISARDVITHPSVAQLARIAQPSTTTEEPVVPFELVTDNDRSRLWFAVDAYPLAQLQWGMLYHSIESESSTLYHDVFRYTLRLPWDEQAWLRAGARLVERHPALRTSFDVNGFSQPLQIVHREVPSAFTTTDLQSLTAAAATAHITDYIEQQRRYPYRPDAAPLYAVHAFRLPDIVEVVFSFHHAILDGWSVAMLVSQLLGDYLNETGHTVDRAIEIETLPTHADFVRAEQEALASDRIRRFWLEELHDSRATTLDGSEPTTIDGGGAHLSRTVAVPHVVTEAVGELAAAERMPISTVLFAAHVLTLRLITGSSQITTGQVTHNRPARLGAELAAGLFLNTIPVRIDLSGPNRISRDIIRAVRDQELRLDPYRIYPLSAIQRDRGAPVIATAFNFVNFHIAAPLLNSADVEIVDIDTYEQTNFQLMVNLVVNPVDKSMFIRLDADAMHNTNASVDAYIHTYLGALDALITHPDQLFGIKALAPARRLPPGAPIPRATTTENRPLHATSTRPATHAERILAQAFSEVLGVDPVGTEDDFYALGGDSLLVLKVCALAGRRGLRVTARDVVTHPTVAELARVARQGEAVQESVTPFALIADIDRDRLGFAADAYPLAQLQWGMLYHSIESESSTLYHDVFRYTLRLPWDEQAWLRAGARLVERHPALRTSFDVNGFSQPLQIVHREVPLPFATTDLSTESHSNAGKRIADHVRQWRTHAYRFDVAPLFHVHAFRLPDPDAVDVVIGFHHAILDGWSLAMLMSQLLDDYLYEAGHTTSPVETGDPPTYAEFVRAERQALAAPQMRRFWQDTLRGTEPTAIGASGSAGSGSADRITRSMRIPSAVADAARVLATQQRVPAKTILFAAYTLTLRLFSGSPHVTTGMVTHNRPARFGAENVAGLFLNTIPVPVDLSVPGRTWREVIDAVRATELELDPYRAYPLSAIQHDQGGADVIVTAFNYANFHITASLSANPHVEVLAFEVEEQTNFALLLNAIDNPLDNSLDVRIDADGVHVDDALAQAFGDAYLAILGTLTTNPDRAVDFTASAPAEPLTRPQELSTPHVLDAIATHVDRVPDAVAVVHDERTLTYRELWQQAQRIAGALWGRGVRPGGRVGVALAQGPGRIAAVVGVAAIGAAVVPLDTGQPAARLRGMISDAAPRLVLIDGDIVDGIASSLAVDVADLLDAPTSLPAPVLPHHLEQTAYVLFTSGSTGRPKAVTMPHRALANLVAWQLSVHSGRIGDRAPHTLQLAPLTFDVAFQEIFSTLCGGGTLHLADEELRTDAKALVRILDFASIERVFLPYVALQQLAQVATATNNYPNHLSRVVSSGEQLRITPQIKAFLAALPGRPVVENQYGPTETHVAAAHTLTGDPRDFPLLPPIGAPIAGAEIHILDPHLRPVPVGALGEIYLGGAVLADGYERRPDLTAQRYVAHPGGEPAARLYRTGDLGRRHPGGYITYEGRLDTQVKIRGFRVDTAEVEVAIMAAAPAVREVAVVARTLDGAPSESSADTILAAYLVGDRTTADIDDIRRRVAAALPSYEVPAHFEWVDAIARTPSGKRADAMLRRLPLTPSTPPRTTAGPRDGLERELVDLVADVTATDTVGIDDGFFDIGGTSITATRLILALERRYGIEVPMSSFVAAPTVAALAELVRGRSAAPAPDPLVAIKPSGDNPPLFLVHPVGGTVSSYTALARHLPADQPLYALQALGIDAGTTPLETIPDMAAAYVRAIRRVQPEGPYHIGGWSLGGLIAFEMLHQLEAAGHEVATFALLDSMMGRANVPADAMAMATHQLFMWELLRGDRASQAPVPEIPVELRTEDDKLEFILDRAVAEGVVPEGSSRRLIRRLFAVFATTWKAAVHYRPQPTDHDLTLFHAGEPLPEILKPAHEAVGSLYRNATNGWDTMTTGKVAVIDVPGNHLTMMDEPFVAILAETLAKVIHHNNCEERILR